MSLVPAKNLQNGLEIFVSKLCSSLDPYCQTVASACEHELAVGAGVKDVQHGAGHDVGRDGQQESWVAWWKGYWRPPDGHEPLYQATFYHFGPAPPGHNLHQV